MALTAAAATAGHCSPKWLTEPTQLALVVRHHQPPPAPLLNSSPFPSLACTGRAGCWGFLWVSGMMESRLKHQHQPAITPQPPSPSATANPSAHLSLSCSLPLRVSRGRVSGMAGSREGQRGGVGSPNETSTPPFLCSFYYFVFFYFINTITHIQPNFTSDQ